MKSIKELLANRAELVEENKGLVANAEKLGRDFTAEEQELFDANDALIEKLDSDIESRRKTDARKSRLNKYDEGANVSVGRQISPSAPGVSPPERVPAELKANDPTRGFRDHRDFLHAVIDAGKGVRLDRRLQQLAVGSDEARGVSDPYGGFLLPETFTPQLLRIDPEMDPMGGMTRKLPMSTSIVKIPARVDRNHSSSVSGGLVVGRRLETGGFSTSQMSFEQVTLEAHTLAGLSYATEELLTDSPISFIALLEAGFSDQFTSHLINERLFGTGVGEYLGVMNSPCLVSVSKESGQASATISYANIIKMRSRCYGYSRAVWLANHDTMPQLMTLSQVVGVGGSAVWQPSAREDRPDLLLGRPIIFTEYAKTLGTTGDIVLGNWGEYLEGTLQPMQSAESIHVRFAYHERTFKFWVRNAGQPWWKSALTPKNSTNTLSPFVALETR